MTGTTAPAAASLFRPLVSDVLNDAVLLRRLLRPVQRLRPILVLGGQVLVTRHPDVCEVLSRDEDFTVADNNGPRLDRLNGPFLLGMDRSRLYEREKSILGAAVYPSDLEGLRAEVRAAAEEALARASAHGRIDVVADLAGPVTQRLVSSYFGLPGPDRASLLRWMQTIFHAAFLNLGDDATVRLAGERSAAELHTYVDDLVAERRAQVAVGDDATDDVLTRLVRLQADPQTCLSGEGLRRNVSGLAIAAVETIKAVAHAVDELLDRPDALQEATAAARAGDVATVATYTFEALRFRPLNPFLPRRVARPAVLAAGTPRQTCLSVGDTVLAGVLPAMFDPSVVEDPDSFRTDRPPLTRLIFGHGLHRCFGERINLVQIPETVAALLATGPVRRAPGAAGRLSYDGPFASRLVVELDARAGVAG